MKVLKNNLWNKIFNKKKLEEQEKEVKRLEDIVKNANEYLPRLARCDDLMGLMYLHRELWACGLQNKNIGPCKDGMFRTEDIMTMKPDEVFLGDVYSLWTFSIPEWEKRKGVKYGEQIAILNGLDPDITVYEIACKQYRNLLMTNVALIKSEAVDALVDYSYR